MAISIYSENTGLTSLLWRHFRFFAVVCLAPSHRPNRPEFAQQLRWGASVPTSVAGIDGRLIQAEKGRVAVTDTDVCGVAGKDLSEMIEKMVNAAGISHN